MNRQLRCQCSKDCPGCNYGRLNNAWCVRSAAAGKTLCGPCEGARIATKRIRLWSEPPIVVLFGIAQDKASSATSER